MSIKAVARDARPTPQGEAAGFSPPDEVVVGRDVLELVSSAMYVDPMSIYREYIQNAADAVDAARVEGLLRADERGRVDIEVDAAGRTVRIRDNGVGVRQADFVRRMSAIGASVKRNTTARGFRGVGRLAGLGYAQELVFRSRAAGDALVSEVRWNCRALRAALRSQEGEGGVSDLVRSVVTAGQILPGAYPDHFFEVELKGVVRLKGDKLMSPHVIADYLGQVGPVPFSPKFRLGAEITAALRAMNYPLELDVRVADLDDSVYRPHQNSFLLNNTRISEFRDLSLIELPGVDGQTAGLAWILHHDYEGAIPQSAHVKGLRMRSGNIQVGDNTLLEELFPEARFNAWSVGEIHVLDRRILPNARRDHFEQNSHLNNLFNQLLPTARDIARRCRTSSVRRRWLRQFELHRLAAEAGVAAIEQRASSHRQRLAAAAEVSRLIAEMVRISEMQVLFDDGPDALAAVCAGMREALRLATSTTGKEETSPLAALPRRRRETYEHMFDLIYACSPSKASAKALVDRIVTKVVRDTPP